MATLNFDLDKQMGFLINLLNIHSPTGYHHEAISYVQQAFKDLKISNLKISLTPKGALVAFWKGTKSTAPRGVTAHADTLGFMVKEIKNNGCLRVARLGGVTLTGAEYENVTVRTYDDTRYRGTFLPVNPSSHVNSKVHKMERTLNNMEVRLDVKTSSKSETEAYGIGVGDFVFLDTRVEVTDTGYIRSRFLDDKAGVANIYGALVTLKEAGLRPAQDTTFLITNYEEVGHGGSHGLPDNLSEVLAIDMGAIGDGQTSDEYSVSICVKDGGGPYHFEMNNKLRRLAEDNHIPYNVDIYTYYASDGTAYWRSGGQARVGLIGPGVASSHAYERTHKDALLHSTRLITHYLLDEG